MEQKEPAQKEQQQQQQQQKQQQQQQHKQQQHRQEQTLRDKMASLSAIWESYAQLIRRKADRRSELKLQQRRFVLDTFLGHFISASLENQGDICIGEMRNIGNELSQEFMRNLDVVTRGVSEEDATRSLEDYILRDRGWKLLYTVDRVGLKGVIQRQDLCEVLLYLLPYCLHMKPSSPTNSATGTTSSSHLYQSSAADAMADTLRHWQILSDTYDTSQPLNSCFQLVSKSSRLKQLGCPSVQTRKLHRVTSTASQMDMMRRGRVSRGPAKGGGAGLNRSPGKNGTKGGAGDVGAGRTPKKRMTRSTPSKKAVKATRSESEEEEEDHFQQTHPDQPPSRRLSQSEDQRSRNRQQPRFKRGIRTSHLWAPATFNREEDSDTDDEYLGHMVNNSGRTNAETLSSVTGFHVVRVALGLLRSLGELDVGPQGCPRGRALSATILPHLLYLFSQFRQPGLKAVELNSVAKAEMWLDNQQRHNYNSGKQQNEQDGLIQSDGQTQSCARGSPTSAEVESANPKSEEFDNGEGPSEEELESVPWYGACKMLVLRQLVRAILALSGIIATQQNGVRILMNLKVVDTLLDLDILDSLIPQYDCGAPHPSTPPASPGLSSTSSEPSTSLEATVAMEIVCGLLQLLQTVYTNLPFNPSCVSDANHLVSKLTRPEVSKRIKRLIRVAEVRTYLQDKTSSSTSDLHEFDLCSLVEECQSQSKPTREASSQPSGKNPSSHRSLSQSASFDKDNVENESKKTISEVETLRDTTEKDSNKHWLDSSFTEPGLGISETNVPKDAQDDDKEIHMDKSSSVDKLVKQEYTPADDTKPAQGKAPIHEFSSSYEYTPDATSDPVRCIGSLITTLKGIKVNYIHSMKCLKQRHRNCEYGIYYDHHHDILGSPFYTSSSAQQEGETTNDDADYEQSQGSGGRTGFMSSFPANHSGRKQSVSSEPHQSQPRCIVAELVSVLLESVSQVRQKSSQVHVISTLGSVGVCCCLQPERVVSTVVGQLVSFSPAVRSFALDTLTTILLEQFLGAREDIQGSLNGKSHRSSLPQAEQQFPYKDSSRAKEVPGMTGWAEQPQQQPGGASCQRSGVDDSSRCVHCYLEGSSPLLAGLPSTMDSGFASCQVEELRRQRMLDRWRCLRGMGRLVVGRDQGLALSCAKHLMTLAVRGNREVKEELFFGVYLHVLHMKVALPSVGERQSRADLVSSMERSLDEGSLEENRFVGANGSKKKQTASKGNRNEVNADYGQTLLQMSLDSLSTEPFTTSDPATSGGDLSSTDEGYGEGYVSSPIMLLCVSALPYLLQVDKVMSIFLARRGLTKLTHLLEYEELRAPVMSVFEALVMIDERRLSDSQQQGGSPTLISFSVHEQSTYEGGGVIQTFIDTVASRTCAVTATLQQISLQKEKAEAAKAAMAAATENHARDKKTNARQFSVPHSPPAENSEFLDMYKSHMKKVHETSRASDSETSPRDSMSNGMDDTEVVIDTDAAFGDMAETLPVLLDMWKTCAKLCMNSRMFRLFFRESPYLYVVQETLVLALSLLGEMSGGCGRASNPGSMPASRPATQPGSPLDTGGGGATRFWQGCGKDGTGWGRGQGRSYPVSEASQEAGPESSKDGEGSEGAEHSELMSHQARLEFIEAVMMVCFSCRTISPSQKRGQEDDLWMRLSTALHSCIYLEPCKLSAVFQMLLNVALPRCPSVLEYSYSQIVSMLNLKEKEDIADEDEVTQLLQAGLDEDGDTIYTEHGYDGDTECSVAFDWKTGLEYSLQHRAARLWNTPSGASCPCFPAVFRLLVELLVACHRDAGRGVILHTVALRLLQTLRSSRRAVRAVCSEGLLSVLMEGFTEVLVAQPQDGQQLTLQEIILSLVQVIAQREVSAAELKQFLRLFQDNKQTTNSLLSTLLSVIEKHPVSPNRWAMFPAKTLVATDIHAGSADESEESADIPNEQAVWHHAAVEMDCQGIQWPPWPVGFTLAFWLAVDRCNCGRPCCCKMPGTASQGDRVLYSDRYRRQERLERKHDALEEWGIPGAAEPVVIKVSWLQRITKSYSRPTDTSVSHTRCMLRSVQPAHLCWLALAAPPPLLPLH